MKKIGVVINPKKAGAVELLQKLQNWLAKRDVGVKDSLTCSPEDILADSDMVVCLGGDGTLLSVASRMKEKAIPVLGVNLGSLGFITEVKGEELFEELNCYFLNQSQVEERLMISCSARSEKARKERRLVALNDMVISREGLTRLLHVEVFVNGESLTRFRGDGVIVSTPTGSTAYSLSAGGAIVHPKLEALVVTPICPHALALRSIVLAGDEKVAVKIKTDRDTDRALLAADGQENFEIDDSYIVEIMRSNTPLQLIKSSKRSFFGTLREKFDFSY